MEYKTDLSHLASDPIGYARETWEALQYLDEIHRVPAAIERMQDDENPFPSSDTVDHTAYETGWYRGYVAWMAVSMVAGGSATNAAKSTKTFKNTVDRLKDGSRYQRAADYITSTARATRSLPRRAVDYSTLRSVTRSTDLGEDAAKRVLGNTETAVQRYRVARNVRKLDSTTVSGLSESEQVQLGRYLARHGSDGRQLLTSGGENLVPLVIDTDRLNEETTSALVRAHRRGDLSDANLQRTARYLDEGRMDQADVRRMTEILEARSSDPLIHEDVTTGDLLKIAEKGDAISKTRVVTRGSTGTGDDFIVRLQEGGEQSGWTHIQARHITGTQIADDDITSFFPTGKTIEGRELPSTVSGDQVQHMIEDAVRHGEYSSGTGGRHEFMFRPTENGYSGSGISQMRVVVNPDGSIRTAFPEQGQAVNKWHPEHGWVS